MGRATAFQAVGREFEARLPLSVRRCSSAVEYFLGKEEVTGSNPVIGSMKNFLCKHNSRKFSDLMYICC